MGTFLKYLFYIALVVVIYLVGKGVYEGQIDEKTTVGQVVSDIGTGTKEMVKNGVNATENAIDNYKKTPKEDIDLAE